MAFVYCRECSGKVEMGTATCPHCGIPRPTVFRRPSPASPTVRHRIAGARVVLLWAGGVVLAVGLIVPAMSYSARGGAPGSAFVPGATGIPAETFAPAAPPSADRAHHEQVASALRRAFPGVQVTGFDAGAPHAMRIVVPLDYPSYRARVLAADAHRRLGADGTVEVRDPSGRTLAQAGPGAR